MPVSALKTKVNTYCRISKALLFLTEHDTKQEFPRSHKQTPARYSVGAFPDTYLGRCFHTRLSWLAANASWAALTGAAVSTTTRAPAQDEELPGWRVLPCSSPPGKLSWWQWQWLLWSWLYPSSLHLGTLPDVYSDNVRCNERLHPPQDLDLGQWEG